MSIPLDDFDTAPQADTDFRRDQWGRPLIMQADGTRKGYTRSSGAAKTIEDTFNLEKWARRNVAYGLAHDASLVARVLAIGGEPSSWQKADKDAVNAVVKAAEGVAKAHKAADIGTAVHKLTERLDRGEDVVGGPYQADLDAYRAALNAAGLSITHVECRMVNDDLEMAGTADRIVSRIGLGFTAHHHYIADLKTSASVDFGGLGWAAQLAAYAGGVLYDAAAEQRIDTPDIDQTVGYIIHLPAGQGVCTIYEVDLVAGLAAAKLANDIRSTRKASKKWIRPLQIEREEAALPPSPPALTALRTRYKALDIDLQERFKEKAIPADDIAGIAAALDELEHPPTMLELARERMAENVLRNLDHIWDTEGAEVDVVEELRVLSQWMTPEQRAWVGAVMTAPCTGRSIRYSHAHTQRRAHICLALAKWAVGNHWDADTDEGLRAAIYVVTGDAASLWDNAVTITDALSQLDLTQAAEFKDLVDAICDDHMTLTYDETSGHGRWTQPAA